MMRLMALIIAIFAVITTAWAGDYQGRTTLEYYLSPGEYEEIMRQIHENAPSTEGELSTKDIADLLQRCLEFLQDGNEDVLRGSVTNLVYHPVTPLSNARDAAKNAEEYVKRLERETALRKDIESVIKALKGER